jgi:hypothetical protein
MSAGVGNFLSGFTQGYAGMRRLGIEEERAAQQREEFEFNKSQREMEQKTREETATAMAALETSYRAPQQQAGIKDPNAPEPMSESDYYYERAKILANAGVKLGKFSLADEKALKDAGREVSFDRFRNAVKHAYSNPDDVAGISKRLNKSGINLPEGIRFQTVPMDPNDPNSDLNLVGFVPGEDGKPKQVFSYMDALPLFAASEVLTADALATKKQIRGIKADRENVLTKEKGDTFRTGMTTEASLRAAAMKNASEGRKLNPEVDAFNDRMNKEFEAVFKGPQFGLNPREESLIRGEISALGRQLIDAGMNGNQAYLVATQEVIKKNKIPVNISKIK